MAELQMEGWAEIKSRLTALPDKLVKGILDQSLRQAANVVRDAARENFDRGDPFPNEQSGWLKRTIRTTKRRGSSTRVVYNVVAGGAYTQGESTKVRPSYALWVEYGHRVVAKGQARSGNDKRMGTNAGGLLNVPPHPFMRPAIEQNAQLAVDFVIAGVSDRLPELVR